MSEEQTGNLKDWYESARPRYEGFTNILHNTVDSLIRNANIDYLSVTSRTKTLDSFAEKVDRKNYQKRENVTDLSGIRVITFIESDARKVCDLIKSSFNVHASDSLDKANDLGVYRFGYRSFHYVCDLGGDRLQLLEYSLYEGLLFEVQVRTVLQHAWAEIEHDRNYKFSGVLPDELQRRLHLLAGVLEVVDREFVALAKDVDSYVEQVTERTRSGDLHIELTTTSWKQYLSDKRAQLEGLRLGSESNVDAAIGELRDFSVRTLADLDRLLNEELIAAEGEYEAANSERGLLRDVMMYEDIDRYFGSAWQHKWHTTDSATVDMLASKYGLEKVNSIFQRYGVEVED